MTAEIKAKSNMFFSPNGHNPPKYLPSDNDNMNERSINISRDKEVVKENTRLPDNFLENLVSSHSQKMKRKLYETYENSDVVKLLKELKKIDEEMKEEKLQPLATPHVNGYKLMKEPEPTPGIIDPIPLFTWGEVASTPNLINSNIKKFSVPQTPARETLAHKLANKSRKEKEEVKT